MNSSSQTHRRVSTVQDHHFYWTDVCRAAGQSKRQPWGPADLVCIPGQVHYYLIVCQAILALSYYSARGYASRPPYLVNNIPRNACVIKISLSSTAD